MMPSLNPIIRTVANMINSYGGTSTLVVPSDGGYDPATSTNVETETRYDVKAIAFDYIQKTNGFSNETNMLIRTGDKQIFVKADDLVPRPNPRTDSFIYNGVTFTIIAIKDLNPSGSSSILWEMFVRE